MTGTCNSKSEDSVAEQPPNGSAKEKSGEKNDIRIEGKDIDADDNS
jgi:hypothetical protein